MKNSVKSLKNELTPPLKAVHYSVSILIFWVMVLPLVNVLALSFSTSMGSMAPGVRLWPDAFTVEGYREVWARGNVSRAFFNSAFVTCTSILIQSILSALAGYVLIQKELPFKRMIVSFVMITMMIPPDLTLISIYAVNKQLNLLNSYQGLIINGLVSGFSILLMRNYYLSVPDSLSEAAKMDNAKEFRIFWSIYLPLSLPGLATVTFLEFVTKWNAMMIPVTIITEPELFTLPMLLRSMVINVEAQSGLGFTGPNTISAAIIISILPLILLYFVAQRFLIGGITLGATKG